MHAILVVPVILSLGVLYLGYTVKNDPRKPFQFSKQQVLDYHQGSAAYEIEYLENELDHRFFVGAQSVLDVGCGDGKITAFIARQHPECTVVGSDVSSEMITFATQRYPVSEYPNLHFIHKDVCDLGFVSTFDRVVSFNCLHWISDQKRAFQAIHASLKPGGKALMVVVPRSSHDLLQASCRSVIISFKWLPSFLTFRPTHSFHTQEEYQQMLTAVGFVVNDITSREVIARFASRAEAEVFLRSVVTPVSHVPEHQRTEFLDDLFTEFAKQGAIDADGSVAIRISQMDLSVSKA